MDIARQWFGRLGAESLVAYASLIVGLVMAIEVLHRAWVFARAGPANVNFLTDKPRACP